jgi:hypothetical protein
MDAADAAIDLGEEPDLPARDIHLPRAGIAIYASERRRACIATRMGGAYSVYVRRDEGWTLVREEAGYLLKSAPNRGAWVTRLAGVGELKEHRPDGCRIEAPFVRSLHDEVTPPRMLLLRVLNLTVLRVQWLADVFRKLVVRHLISGVESLPLRLERSISLEQDAITVTDRIVGNTSRPSGTQLYACRRVTGAHMASSRYFQAAELDGAWLEALAWDHAGPFARTQRIEAKAR